MEIKRSNPANNRMNSIVEYGQFVYLAGIVAEGSNITEQTQKVLKNIDDLLEKAGSDKHHILRATIFLKDMSLFSEMNAVWDKWVTIETAPARATMQASLAGPDFLIEIIIDAVKK